MSNLWVQLLPGVVSAVIASYLAARWSMKRLYSEKWWQRKEQAYSDIIEALYDLLQYCEFKKEDYGDREESDKMKEIAEKYTSAYWKVKKATTIGAFSLSEDATRILRELNERPKLEWYENPSWEIYEHDYKFYAEALEKLVSAANNDLKAR